MHVFETICNLLNDSSCFLFWQFLFFLDALQTAIRKGLQNEIEVVFIVEAAEV